MPRTPAQLLAAIRRLQNDQETLEVELKQAQAEVRSAVAEEVTQVLSRLLRQAVDRELRIRRVKDTKRVVFEISFAQVDLTNQPEAQSLMAELTHLGKRTGTNIVEEE